MDLRLFGAVHVDRPGTAAADLRAVADDVDAFLLERPAEWLGLRPALRVTVRAPLAAVGLAVTAAVQAVALAALVRDLRPVEQVAAEELAAERGVPVHGVDPAAETLADWGGPWWVAANWVLLAALVLAAPLAGVLTAAGLLGARVAHLPVYRRSRTLGTLAGVLALGGVGLALAATGHLSAPVPFGGVLAAGLLTLQTLPVRDADMAERALDVAAREGYDSACLIAGRAHVPGLRRELARRGVAPTTVHRMRFLRSGVTSDAADLDDVDPGGTRPDRTARDVLGRRAVAAVVDLAGSALAAVAAAVLCVPLYADTYSDATAGALAVLAALAAGFCYYAVPEALGGQTPGKRLVGVVAVSYDGSPLSTRAAVVRNLTRPVDAVFGYALGFLVAVLADGQRLGDLAADTLVVDAP